MQSYTELNYVCVFYVFPSIKEGPFLSETWLWDLMALPQSTNSLFLDKFSAGAYKTRGNSDSHAWFTA